MKNNSKALLIALAIFTFNLLHHSACNAQTLTPFYSKYHNLYGYKNEKNNVVISPSFIYAEAFDFQLAIVRLQNGNFNLLNKKAALVLKNECIEIARDVVGYKIKTADKLWGLADSSGNFILQPDYNEIMTSNLGISMVSKNGLWGAVDCNGKFTIPVKYPYLEDASNLFLSYKDKIQKIDPDGNAIFDNYGLPIYEITDSTWIDSKDNPISKKDAAGINKKHREYACKIITKFNNNSEQPYAYPISVKQGTSETVYITSQDIDFARLHKYTIGRSGYFRKTVKINQTIERTYELTVNGEFDYDKPREIITIDTIWEPAWKKFYILNTRYELVNAEAFKTVMPFGDLFWVKTFSDTTKFFLLDPVKGDLKETPYSAVVEANNSTSIVKKNDNWYLCNLKGKTISKPYSHIYSTTPSAIENNEGSTLKISTSSNYLCAIIDKNSDAKNEVFGIINNEGKEIIKPGYNALLPELKQHFIASKGGANFIINADEKMITQPDLSDMYYGSVYFIKTNSDSTIIFNPETKIKYPFATCFNFFQMEEQTPVNAFSIGIEKGTKKDMVVTKQRTMEGVTYTDTIDKIKFYTNPLFTLITSKGEKFKISELQDLYFYTNFISKSIEGNTEMQVNFEHLNLDYVSSYFNKKQNYQYTDTAAIIGYKKNGKWGMCKADGKILAEAEFDSLFLNYNQGMLNLKKGNKNYMVNKTGKITELGYLSTHYQRNESFAYYVHISGGTKEKTLKKRTAVTFGGDIVYETDTFYYYKKGIYEILKQNGEPLINDKFDEICIPTIDYGDMQEQGADKPVIYNFADSASVAYYPAPMEYPIIFGKKNGTWGGWNLNGEVIIPQMYEKFSVKYDGESKDVIYECIRPNSVQPELFNRYGKKMSAKD